MMVINGNQKPVVYQCAVVSNGMIGSQDSRFYRRLGDAKKRCKRLNELENAHYEILCAYGWGPLTEVGDSE